jgi:hypothetical protein
MTSRPLTIALFSLFSIACAEESSMDVDDYKADLVDTDHTMLASETIAGAVDGDESTGDDGDAFPGSDGVAGDEGFNTDRIAPLTQSLMREYSDDGCEVVGQVEGLWNEADGTLRAKLMDMDRDLMVAIDASLGDDEDGSSSWGGDWYGVAEEDDGNDGDETEVETGTIEGFYNRDSETFEGVTTDESGPEIEFSGHWVEMGEEQGMMFGVAAICE